MKSTVMKNAKLFDISFVRQTTVAKLKMIKRIHNTHCSIHVYTYRAHLSISRGFALLPVEIDMVMLLRSIKVMALVAKS